MGALGGAPARPSGAGDRCSSARHRARQSAQRLRTDWTCFALNGNAQIFEQIAEDLTGKAREEGATRVLDWLDDTLSHAIRISARRSLEVIDFATALDELYRKHVGGRERQP